MTKTIYHGRVALALHTLHTLRNESADRPPLLLLHALFGSSADWRSAAEAWPGAVYALDFSGHGESAWLPGHGYSPEVFAAEADAALANIGDGPVYVAGAGVGAYVALLLAGARPGDVQSALLLPGEGLAGGGALPDQQQESAAAEWLDEATSAPAADAASPDPRVRRCTRDVRPRYYAEEFARAARPLWVANMPEAPPWLETAIQFGETVDAPSDPIAAVRALARL